MRFYIKSEIIPVAIFMELRNVPTLLRKYQVLTLSELRHIVYSSKDCVGCACVKFGGLPAKLPDVSIYILISYYLGNVDSNT